MLKAGSLVYAIVISVVVAMISSSLILLSYFTSIHIDHFTDIERVQMNVSSGIRILLSDKAGIASGKQELDLFGTGKDSVLLEKRSWGAFEVGISEGLSRQDRFSKIALMGGDFSEDSTLALYLEDQDKPLSLCGRTVLHGTCVLPKAGLKRAYIEGQNFVGSKMTDGVVTQASQMLPLVNKVALDKITSFFLNRPNGNDSALLYEESPDTVIAGFSGKTVFLYSAGKIKMDSKKIAGNVVVISKKEIEIGTNAILQDIIVYAPKVRVEDGFSGNLQVFASDTLIIGKGCRLQYPSVVGLIRTEVSVDNPAMFIKEKTEIEGIVFGCQEKYDNRKNLIVSLHNGVLLVGHLYCNGLLDLKGSVYGSVLCRKFILKTPSSVYENHLLNAVIDRTLLPKFFVGFGLMQEAPEKEIVKWLY